jgi:class 3 adenylate cyclase/ligand-binding sensor domain-containing protein
MSYIKYAVLLFFCFLTTVVVKAQEENVDIKIYGFEEGLTHRNVFKIVQDQSGFIWLATINGLNRFDGHSFLQYKSNHPQYKIPYDYVSDLVVGSDSALWLASHNYLTKLDLQNNQTTIIFTDSTSQTFQQPKDYHGLYVDEGGEVLTFAHLEESNNSYFQRLSSSPQVRQDQRVLKDILLLPGTYAKRAVLKVQGTYFVTADENTIWQVGSDGNKLGNYEFPNEVNGSPSLAWINQLQITKDGTIWALLNNGQVYYLNTGETQFKQHPITEVLFGNSITSAFLVEEDGDIWVGGMGNLWYYEAYSGETKNYDSSIREELKTNINYRQIFKDASGVIWIASDYGAIKIVRSDKIFNKYMDEGNEYCETGYCSMRGITEDANGNIYLSYYNSIHVLDAQTGVLRSLFPKSEFTNYPFGLLYHQGALYTGNGKRIQLSTLKIDTLINQSIVDLGHAMVDNEGEVWMGYRNRIYIYNPINRRTRIYDKPMGLVDTTQLDVSYLYQSEDRTIWMGTLNDGLFAIEKERGVIAHYHNGEGSKPRFRNNQINVIYEDSQGLMWLGTGNGLHRWNRETDELVIYDKQQGLANSFINGLLPESDSCLWISTDNGLARINYLQNAVSLFFMRDGLSANEFNRASFYKAKDGRMFFGGLNGINAFYPSERYASEGSRQQSKILFSGFSKLDGNSDSMISQRIGLSNKEPVELSYKDRYFSFEFALADFKNPGANIYSFVLEGYENNWSEPSQVNIARYNAVPAGEYIFKVRATNSPGNWIGEELKVPIVVEKAFYKTFGFMLVCFFVGLSLIAGILEYRVYQNVQQRKKLQSEVKARTLELEHEKRKSDELLLNILPAEIAEELKQFGKAKARRYTQVTVLFTDFKSFTQIAEQLSPEELVAEIDYCFKNFDTIIEKHGIEKIKTIGDAYMCAGGIPLVDEDNPQKVINAALDIRDFMLQLANKRKKENKVYFNVRLGIHSGDVVAGIVGTKKFAFDIWGDAVNIAARMEETSKEGKINISGATFKLVKDMFTWEYRGKIPAKNKGEVDMYFVERKASNDQS